MELGISGWRALFGSVALESPPRLPRHQKRHVSNHHTFDPRIVRIDRLRVGDGRRLRAIRLQALQDAPDAFGTTLREALDLPDRAWHEQLLQLATFVASVGDVDVGLVRGQRHDQLSETGYLISLWVVPHMRHRGLGSRLIDELVAWAKREGLQQLVLDVADSNIPALALYMAYGFRPNGADGTLPPPREHIREIQLELQL